MELLDTNKIAQEDFSVLDCLKVNIDNTKSHLLNCRCDTFANITSPTQLQDGTTYDSTNIIHHICMKSTENYSEISVLSSISSSQTSSLFSEVVNFSLTG